MESVMEWQHEGRTLEVETERIEFTTALPQPDPRWTYTDRAGHEHSYGQRGSAADRYPTLERRESEPYWCSDCDDEHTDVWFECALCGERINPGTVVDTSPQYTAGRTTYLIDGHPVTEVEGKALLEEIQTVSSERRRTRDLEQAREKAHESEVAMRAEGLSEQQIQRVVNRLVHGSPDGEQ